MQNFHESANKDKIDNSLRFIAAKNWQSKGKGFFDGLVEHLSQNLGVKYAFVDKLSADNLNSVVTIALYVDGDKVPNICYGLKDTPCEKVIGNQLQIYAHDVQGCFPKDQLLVDMGAESYAGIPLWSSDDEPLGLIAVMDDKPLVEVETVQAILQVVALRAAAELERQLSDQALAAREQELKRLNETLHQLVSERTKELEMFSYSVAHDLRAPLRSINGFCTLVQEEEGTKISPEGNVKIGRVIEATKQMDKTIDDMLALTRLAIKDGHRKDIELDKIAGDVIADLQRQNPRNVDISIQPHLHAFADPQLMTLVFDVLLSNAWKFTRDVDGAKISLSSTVNKQGQTVYCLQDNGVGFDMTFASHLFLPFHRLHDPSEFEGRGIGLALAKRAIEKHNGSIWLQSEKGAGTAVYFTLDHVEA